MEGKSFMSFAHRISIGAAWFRVYSNEPIAIRHFHFGQSIGVHFVSLADDAVCEKQVRGDCIKLIVGE